MTKADKEGQRKAPILRFKGFTDAWEQRKLSEMTQQVKRTSDSENPILTISAKNGWMDQKDRFNRVIAGKELKNYIELYKNELSYNHGNSKYAKFGIIYVQRKYEKALVPKVYHSFSMSYGDPRFIENLSLGHKLDKELSKLITSGARQDGLLNINKKSFYTIKLFTPSEQEQIKISNIMDVINHVITLYEKKKQLLTQLKQGIVNFLITKNGQKPQLRFIGFNNNWESKSFEKLLNYEQPTKYIVKKTDYISQGTPVLTANKSFILGYTNENNVYQNIPAIIFDDFTLESKYVDFPFMIKSSAIKILTSKNSNLFFIYQLLNNQRFVQEGHSRHYISVVQKKKVLVPFIQEQNKIGNLIKQLKNNIEQNSNTITLLKRLKEFLLQNMFL
ncbi:hypothetical protein A3O17_05620 [Ligilactobacillus aviarius]|uniref:restriction endonuclease subunit S n=1 Tax=Ligilactobacillus aviarius TaxID=1606 RepID=UPI0007D97F67|nr:restriction endonuclease subunit S [Ligilactobacillus aviarius]OAQ07546.1 hypothetical protein A3O15_00945 [Ligilactobacillus aviarius]OAS76195.1 hypothetical protein A3O17_05620 [Ligilactobacillus aviarius]